MSDIRKEMDEVIKELETKGLNKDSHTESDVVGLGDVVEEVLTRFGITQERFKEWFNLQECGCSKRKAWLNNLFSWQRSSK